MPLKPGDRIERYVIDGLLGTGGMGEVYRAHDPRLKRAIALKILHADAAPDPARSSSPASGAAARMMREAQLAASLDHPNVVSIFDVGQIEQPEELRGTTYLAMELIRGEPLRKHIGDPGVRMKQRVRWLEEIARALGAAHAAGLVHRDIKPENVMIREDGIVKVLDFGIAKRTIAAPVDPTSSTEGFAVPTMTAQGVVVGTPMYMAPEQLRAETLDGRADQFAWGVVAYELLTGKALWSLEGGGFSLVAQILQAPAPSLTEFPGVTPRVAGVVARSLMKDPAARFPTMEALLEELTGKVEGGDTEPKIPLSPSSPDLTLAQAPTQSSGKAAVISGGAPGGAIPTTERSAGSTAPAKVLAGAPSARGSKRYARAAIAALAAAALLALGVVAWRASPARTPQKRPPPSPTAARGESAMSANPEAASAQVSGMRALRDASILTASADLDRAIRLDPSFTLAHLQRAFVETAGDKDPAIIQSQLRDVRLGRDSLGASDRAMLDALEPWTTNPADLNEARRRLDLSTKTYPGVAELAFERGVVLNQLDLAEEAIAAAQQTLALDPTYAIAWELVAYARQGEDDVPGAIDAEERCLRLSPGADTCLWSLAKIQRGQGRCEDLVATTRKIVSLTPDSSAAYRYLAGGLVAEGEPMEAARVALDQAWERASPGQRHLDQMEDEAAVAILVGNFRQADEKYAALERAQASAPEEFRHYFAQYGRMLIASETGRDADVARLASSYLAQRAAWTTPGMIVEPTINVYALDFVSGGMSQQAFAAQRDRWHERDAARRKAAGFGAAVDWVWAKAYAKAVRTKDDAIAALAVRDARDAGRPFFNIVSTEPELDEAIGRTYLLAGQLEDAAAFLTRASRTCAVFKPLAAIPIVRATLELGETLEARGDTAGACAAYESVLSRWGKATPASTTAAKARSKSSALGCSKGAGPATR